MNFLNCHDGFTLWDMYSYSQKHNEANGWCNLDGSDDNRSWNCGAEGDTSDEAVLGLKKTGQERGDRAPYEPRYSHVPGR